MLALSWLFLVGAVLGTYGTLIGAGGAFMLVPFLLLVYPHEPPEVIASISLAVVFANAGSGTAAYARMRRIDYRSGLMFAAATIPGAVIGALLTSSIPRVVFDAVLGALMAVIGGWLLIDPGGSRDGTGRHAGSMIRVITERDGTTHRYAFRPWVGVTLSLLVGLVSSSLGIGGGIIHVAVLTQLLDFPVHIATATSHFTIAIMALTGTIVHIATGSFSEGWHRTIWLAAGALVGAQVGARLSSRLRGAWIIRGLALALLVVGVRLVWGAI